MRFLSRLFGNREPSRDDELPFVTQWVLSDLDVYAPKYPVHDPLVISSALEFVSAFFLIVGAEFPERVRELLEQLSPWMKFDDQQIDRFLDRSHLPADAAQLESLSEISEQMFRHNTRVVCANYLARRRVPVAEGQDPATVALGVGLDESAVTAIFQSVALNAMKNGYMLPAGVTDLVDDFLASVAHGFSALQDLAPDLDLDRATHAGFQDAAGLRNLVERMLTAYDAGRPLTPQNDPSKRLDPLVEREIRRSVLRAELDSADNPIASGIFGVVFGGGPVFGAILLLGLALGSGMTPYLVAGGIVAGLWGVLAAVAYMDTGSDGTQAAATGGWVIGFLLAVTSGVVAVGRAVF